MDGLAVLSERSVMVVGVVVPAAGSDRGAV
jgi:hypothetical protein